MSAVVDQVTEDLRRRVDPVDLAGATAVLHAVLDADHDTGAAPRASGAQARPGPAPRAERPVETTTAVC